MRGERLIRLYFPRFRRPVPLQLIQPPLQRGLYILSFEKPFLKTQLLELTAKSGLDSRLHFAPRACCIEPQLIMKVFRKTL